MSKQSIPVGLASLAMILASLFGASPPLARAADVGAAPDRPAAVSLYVDRADDADITTCTSAPNDCTLRGAINKVNTDNLLYASILFTPTVSQVNLSAPLPALITTGTVVDGFGVRINGAALSTGSMMTIDDSYVWIYGLRFINGAGATTDISVLSGIQNQIEEVFSGAPDDTVNACLSTEVTRTSGVGIYVGPAVTGNSANPSLWIQSSRINCHGFYGIQLDGADGVVIGVDRFSGTPRTNFIGTNPAGAALGNGFYGIALFANGANGAKLNQIRNNWIFNSGYEGIYLWGTGANTINSTYSNAITGNRITGNGRVVTASGIRLRDGAFNNAIGGSAPGSANRIYGNTGNGIRIESSELNGVLGNVIGGSLDYPGNNTGDGILIIGGRDNWIGGYILLLGYIEAGNEIGGNNGDGIRLTSAAGNTAIRRNLIGSDSGGNPRPNGGNGISILSGSYSTTIGTGVPADRNVIAGNAVHGIRIDGATTTSNTIRYNDIGLNSAITPSFAILPNGGFGLVVQNDAHHNRAYDGNYIAHNGSGGIWVLSGARDNQFGPVDNVFSNSGSGILISDAQWNQLEGMWIFGNTRDGIEQTVAGSNNSWSNTRIYDNGGLGIDIATEADDNIPTAGYPVITSVVRAGGVVTVTGTSDTTFSDLFGYRTTTVHLFHGGLDPSGYGEGRTPAGSANTNASGVWRIVYNEGFTPLCYAAYKRVVGSSGLLPYDAGSEFSRSTCRQAFVPMVLR